MVSAVPVSSSIAALRTILRSFLSTQGGPFWAKKHKGAWSIPKGEYDHYESVLEAAVHEFQDETGFEAGNVFVELGEVKQAGGKIVAVWSFEGDCDAADLTSNKRHMEWPPHSGRQFELPEADRGQ